MKLKDGGRCAYTILHTVCAIQSVILWIELGGKPKWLPLNFGYLEVMRTDPVLI